MSAGKRFYVIQDDEQSGPMSWETMKTLNYANRSTKVWTEGFHDWISVTSLTSLHAQVSTVANVTPVTGSSFATGHPGDPSQAAASPYATSMPYKGIPDPVLDAGYVYASPLIRMLVLIFNFLIYCMIYMGAYKWVPYSFMIAILINGALGSYLLGGTLGHYILQVKIVKADTAEDYKNPLLGAVRELMKHIFCLLLVIPMWLLWDDRRQNLYDKLLNTVVVKKTKIAL